MRRFFLRLVSKRRAQTLRLENLSRNKKDNSEVQRPTVVRNMTLRARHQKGNAESFLISAYFPTASFCCAGFFRFLIKNAERRAGGDGLHREDSSGISFVHGI